jgi:hypothetical protein
LRPNFPRPSAREYFSSLDWYFSQIPLPIMIYLFNIYIYIYIYIYIPLQM